MSVPAARATSPRTPSAAELGRLCSIAGALLAVCARDGTIEYVNEAWEQVLGWTQDDLVGHLFLEYIHPDDAAATLREMARPERRKYGVGRFENRYRTRDGSWRDLRWRAEFSNGRWLAVAEDITQRLALERDVLRDPLTGVLNRAALFDRLAHALARAGRWNGAVLVMFLDLDGFKAVNDSLGHAVGDVVLRAVAQRLDGEMRTIDSLARLGGDEFVIVAEDIGDRETAAVLLGRIRAALSEPIPAGETAVSVDASIGLVLATQESADEVLHQADVAMYRAKAAGPGREVWFDDALREEVVARVRLAGDLSGAIARNELRVFYQPLVAVADLAVVGCEALLRWEHPTHGLLEPEVFLPIAEEDGDIVEIGAWVLEQACAQQRRWRLDGNDLAVSVNVSARELADPAYAERVAATLRRTGVDAVNIALEVTETALLHDMRNAVLSLGALKRLGVRIALDDFGRGYSSLEHVKSLPVDVVKVDRTFVAGIADNAEDRAIVRAIAALAAKTGLAVIAEGVETAAQLAELRQLDGVIAQGYYFARPTAPEGLQLDGFLAHGRPGIGDPYVIREFMRQIGIPARM
ncbi:MAG TPA: EAL domain-containing protein [Solirubrobacteraceae bacterium]